MPFSTVVVCACALVWFSPIHVVFFSSQNWNSASFSPHRNIAALFFVIKRHNEVLYSLYGQRIYLTHRRSNSLQKAGAFGGLWGREIKLRRYAVAFWAFFWEKEGEKKALKFDKKESISTKLEERREHASFLPPSQNQATKLTGDKKTWEDWEAEKETSRSCNQAPSSCVRSPFIAECGLFILNGVCTVVKNALLCQCVRVVERVSGMRERKEAEKWARDEGEREKKSSRGVGWDSVWGGMWGMRGVWTMTSLLQWAAEATKTAAAPQIYGGSQTLHHFSFSLHLMWVFDWYPDGDDLYCDL